MTTTAHLRRLAKGRRPARLLLGVLVGLAVVNALILSRTRLWRTYDPRYYRDRLAVCRAGRWDLIVVGGSPVTAGIDVATLEGVRRHGKALEHGFNLGLPLGTVVDMSMAVEHG